jgi:hypothetical protein
MGWQFTYVSTYGTDFPFDFGLALTEQQAGRIPELQQMANNPPGWLQFWTSQAALSSTTACARIPATSRSRGVEHLGNDLPPQPGVGGMGRMPARGFRFAIISFVMARAGSCRGRPPPGTPPSPSR